MSKLLTSTIAASSIERGGSSSGKEKNTSKEVRVGVSRQELRDSGSMIRLIGGDYTSDEEAWLNLANLGCSLMTALRESDSLNGFGRYENFPLILYDYSYGTVLLETSIPQVLEKAILAFIERTSDFLDIQLNAKETALLDRIWKSEFSHFLKDRGLFDYPDPQGETVDYTILLRIGNSIIRTLLLEAMKGRTNVTPLLEISWKRKGQNFKSFIIERTVYQVPDAKGKIAHLLQILGKDF